VEVQEYDFLPDVLRAFVLGEYGLRALFPGLGLQVEQVPVDHEDVQHIYLVLTDLNVGIELVVDDVSIEEELGVLFAHPILVFLEISVDGLALDVRHPAEAQLPLDSEFDVLGSGC
jgi:hypothetical protein